MVAFPVFFFFLSTFSRFPGVSADLLLILMDYLRLKDLTID